MAENTIDNLSIEITASAENLARVLNGLSSGLERLSGAASRAGGGMRDMAQGASRAGNTTDKAGTQSNGARPNIRGVGKDAEDAGKSANKGSHGIDKFWKAIRRVAFYRFVRSVIRSITDAFKTGITNLYQWSDAVNGTFAKSMDRIATSTLYLKNSLGALLAPLINALAPAIDIIIDKFVSLINIVNQFFSALSGSSTYTAAKKVATAWNATSQKVSGSAKKTASEIKRTILGFDELNVLQKKNESSGGSGSGSSTPSVASMFETRKVNDNIKSIANAIRNTLGPIFDWLGKNFGSVGSVVATIGAGILAWKIGSGLLSGLGSVTGALEKIKILALAAFDAIMLVNEYKIIRDTFNSYDKLQKDYKSESDSAQSNLDKLYGTGDPSKVKKFGKMVYGIDLTGTDFSSDSKKVQSAVDSIQSNVPSNIWTGLKDEVKSIFSSMDNFSTYAADVFDIASSWFGLKNPSMKIGEGIKNLAAGIAGLDTSDADKVFSDDNISSFRDVIKLKDKFKKLFGNGNESNKKTVYYDPNAGAIPVADGRNSRYVSDDPNTIPLTIDGLNPSSLTLNDSVYKKFMLWGMGSVKAGMASVPTPAVLKNVITDSLKSVNKSEKKTSSMHSYGGKVGSTRKYSELDAFFNSAPDINVKTNLVPGKGGASSNYKNVSDWVKATFAPGAETPIKANLTPGKGGTSGFFGNVASWLGATFKEGTRTKVVVDAVKNWVGTLQQSLKIDNLSTDVKVNAKPNWSKASIGHVGSSMLSYLGLTPNNLSTTVNVGARTSWGRQDPISYLGLGHLATTIAVYLEPKTKEIKLNSGGGGTWRLMTKALGGILSNGLWSDIPQYAGGKYGVSHGTMFWAGENGAEIVGNAGGRTEVLNRSQIASSIFSAVRAAMAPAASNFAAAAQYMNVGNSEYDNDSLMDMIQRAVEAAMSRSNDYDRQKLELLRQINDKDLSVEYSTSAANKAQTRMNRRAGVTVVPVG